MIELSNVKLPLDAGTLEGAGMLRGIAAQAAGIGKNQVADVRIIKRSVDARKRGDVHLVVTLGVTLVHPVDEERIVRKGTPERGVNARMHVPYEPLEVPDAAAARQRSGEPRPVVVGTGPAGLFAALCLAKAGLKPLVLERGGCVEERTAAVEEFFAGGPLDVGTNVQFGEGGAGTFSDGKLTTNTKNPLSKHVLRWFVDAGAPEDILVLAKPHIGTDELRHVVRNLRQQVVDLGGEVRFHAQLVGFEFDDGCLAAVRVRDTRPPADGCPPAAAVASAVGGSDGDQARDPGDVRREDAKGGQAPSRSGEERIPATRVILACGHSARDTFGLVYDAGLAMERKPFSMGVRIEHRQLAIDRAQYGKFAGHPALGAADYKMAVHLPNGRGVYTFCMCPGGVVVPAASEEGGVVVNGMSYHARAGENANAALLVGVDPVDFPGPADDVLAGVRLQRIYEQAAYRLAREGALRRQGDGEDGAAAHEGEGESAPRAEGERLESAACAKSSRAADYVAPAQTVGDFLAGESGHASATVTPSYARGVTWADLHKCLPDFVATSLEEALPLMDAKLHGFADPDAVMTGVETRSSSPVRIVRDGSYQATFVSDLVYDADGRCRSHAVVSTGVYPCGEGSGYAGGIMSAAVDGLRVALAVCEHMRGA